MKMNSKSKKYKSENDFYINKKTNKIEYNKKCQNCVNECKQSFQVTILNCNNYIAKDGKNER